MFTDIEGSTRLWEQFPQAMHAALSQHDAILHQQITIHGGAVFKMVGDGLCAAFSTASEALAAAIFIQKTLQSHEWQEIGNIPVRIALHTGTVEERDGDYFGQPLNRLSRLLAAGYGGQILLSLATQELVRDSLPEEVSLLDLGRHRLRDLQRPEHIFQVNVPGLEQAFPTLKTLDSRPNNLPIQATPFIGRQTELAAVHQQLSRPEVRLLTLTGPGGTGKTRLALETAVEMLEDFKDGVFFVILATVSDPELVVPAIAKTMRVREQSGMPIIEVLKSSLYGRQILLILDNFEQLTQAAWIVTELLEACPHLKIIITSRAVLHVYGEYDFAVPPLTLPSRKKILSLGNLSQYEAVRLFIERAQAIKPTFAVTNENAPAIAEICYRLDGLPLAIELAAARINLLSPQSMLSRLEHRLPILTGGAHNLPARQQTLRNTIGWSYDLLSPQEQRLFICLPVFASGFTIEAAEAIVGASLPGDFSIFDGLSLLLDKSLLRQSTGESQAAEGETRLTMLETIREYAEEHLRNQPLLGELRSRHADFYLKLAEKAAGELRGAQQVIWFNRLESEYDNLRAALDWTYQTGKLELASRLYNALSRFWYLRGYPSQGLQWAERLLAQSNSLPKADQAQLLSNTGALANAQGNTALVISYTEKALALYRELGDLRGIADALTGLGIVAADKSEYLTAVDIYTEVLAIHRQLDDRWGAARTLNNLGLVEFNHRNYSQAIVYLQESLDISRQIQDISISAYALLNLGRTMMYRGEPERARNYLEESLELQRQLGNKRGMSFALLNLGELTLEQGNAPQAASLCQESLAICNELEDKRGSSYSLTILGQAAFQQQAYSEAIQFSTEAERLIREIGNRWSLANVLNDLGRAAVARGHLEQARVAFQESLQVWREIKDDISNATNLVGMGTILVKRDLTAKAVRLFGAAATHRKVAQMPFTPAYQEYFDRWIDTAKAKLTPQEFAEAWQQGEHLAVNQAMDEALASS